MKKAIAAMLVLALLLCASALGEEIDQWPGGAVIEEARADLLGTLEALVTDLYSVQGTVGEAQKAVGLLHAVLDAEPAGARVYPWPDLYAMAEYYGEAGEISRVDALSDRTREYAERGMPVSLISNANAEAGTFWLLAQSMVMLNGFYALPEGFENCIAVYDYGEVCLILLAREQTVVGQSVVGAAAYICAPEVEEAFKTLTELAD